MDLQQLTTSILADLNEVRLELALGGMDEAGEKIRGVQKQLYKMGGGNPIDALLMGFRGDAVEQCEQLRMVIDKTARGHYQSDNELMFIKLAAEQLAERIGVYMQKKTLAEAPGLEEVING